MKDGLREFRNPLAYNTKRLSHALGAEEATEAKNDNVRAHDMKNALVEAQLILKGLVAGFTVPVHARRMAVLALVAHPPLECLRVLHAEAHSFQARERLEVHERVVHVP